MATMKMPMAVGTGSGGTCKNGMVSNSSSGTIQIDTGLGNDLTQFIACMQSDNATASAMALNMTYWNKTWDSLSLNMFSDRTRFLGKGVDAINSIPTPSSSNYGLKVCDVTNGVVSVQVMGANSGYWTGDIYWYAE